MVDIVRSQKGAAANWKGLDYQKKFIAFLAVEMLSEDSLIKRITCENVEDVEVEEESKIVYYQVKLTDKNTLRTSEIKDSVKLFASIEAKGSDSKYSEYVIVSNAKIGEFSDDRVRHNYTELDNTLKKQVSDLDEVGRESSFFERLYVEKFPPLQETSHVIKSMISEVLKNENLPFDVLEGIKNDLLSHINLMCTGPVSLEDRDTVDSHEIEKVNIKFKSIDKEIIRKIVESNLPQSTGQDRRTIVSEILTSSYKKMPLNLNDETSREIYDLLDEYISLADQDLMITYLQKFNEYASRYNLYKDSKFLSFLEDQIKNGFNKHIILECLFILHRLIITSKVADEKVFLEYVRDHYFSFFEDNLKEGTERYEYSLFKIEQIMDEIKDLISVQQICEMYWQRIVRTIKGGDIRNNRLANSIDAFNNNKCHLKPEWRKWLITKDEYSDLKNETFNLIHHSAKL
jgi:hypothetical protein